MAQRRWIGLQQLADEVGMAVRTLQYIRAQEPGVLVTKKKGSGLVYAQPDCAINLRTREVQRELQKLNPEDLDEAKERARKIRLEADRIAIKLSRERQEVAPVIGMDAAVERLATTFRTEILGLRPKYAARFVGLGTQLQAAQLIDDMALQLLRACVEACQRLADEESAEGDAIDSDEPADDDATEEATS